MNINKKALIVISVAVLVVILVAVRVAIIVHNHNKNAMMLQNSVVSDEPISPGNSVAASSNNSNSSVATTIASPAVPAKPANSTETKTNSEKSQAAQTPSVLNGMAYQLESFNGSALPTGANYQVLFNNGSITAKFCNSMSGSFTISNNIIKANLISTMMACSTPVGVMDVESAFGKMLGNGAKIVMEGNSLGLTGTDGTNMAFVRIIGE